MNGKSQQERERKNRKCSLMVSHELRVCNAAASSFFLAIIREVSTVVKSGNDSTDEGTEAQKGRRSVCAKPQTEDKQRQDLGTCSTRPQSSHVLVRNDTGTKSHEDTEPKAYCQKVRGLLSVALHLSGWQRGTLRPGSICV